MAAKIPIPDEKRWQVAAKIASMLPVAYGMIFRDVVGADYDRLEQQVFVALAHEAKIVARTFSLPVGTARELVATLAILNTVFFGPEIKSEQVSFESDRAVLLVRKVSHDAAGAGTSCTPRGCLQPVPCLHDSSNRGTEP